jgi:site-specific DNA-methyltransferase (cytosine-N4-specific)
MRPKDAAAAVADTMRLPEEIRSATVSFEDGRGPTNILYRKIRWARQNAVIEGLIPKSGTRTWELAEKGRKGLLLAKSCTVVCVARDSLGAILFADAKAAMGYIERGSVTAIITSPPFPLIYSREYPSWEAERYVDTFLEHASAMRPLLSCDGSLVVNLADVYRQGLPVLNTYQEEIVCAMAREGWSLCGKTAWVSRNKPKTTRYVTQDRTRVANGVETFYWWSASPFPKADNRRVLEPYSERYLKTLAAGGEARTTRSGSRQTSPGLRHRAHCGGRIPFNFVECGSEGPRSSYMRYCKDHGLPPHPARMPHELVERHVRLLSEVGDLVFDPYGGSLRVAAVCRQLGRRYLSSEIALQYLQGGVGGRLGEGMETFFEPLTSATSPSISNPL